MDQDCLSPSPCIPPRLARSLPEFATLHLPRQDRNAYNDLMSAWAHMMLPEPTAHSVLQKVEEQSE
jgi:hypothetical protein